MISTFTDSEFDVRCNLNNPEILVVKLPLDAPSLIICKCPFLNFGTVNDQNRSVIQGLNFKTLLAIDARIMDKPVNLKVSEILLDYISTPKFEGLNSELFMAVLIEELFKSDEILSVRCDAVAFDLSLWWLHIIAL